MKFSEFEQPLRYTFQYKECVNNNENCQEINGYAVISHLTDSYIEADKAKNLALCDVTFLSRMGIKKYNLNTKILDLVKDLPEAVNIAADDCGCLIVKLSVDELLFLDTISGNNNLQETIITQNYDELTYVGPSYYVPRHDSHSCFVLSGINVSNLLAKLCAVDLSEKVFLNLHVAQTNIARVSTIIIRKDLENCFCFYVLVDRAYSQYIWDCIVDAMEEFDGSIIGIDSLKLLL